MTNSKRGIKWNLTFKCVYLGLNRYEISEKLNIVKIDIKCVKPGPVKWSVRKHPKKPKR